MGSGYFQTPSFCRKSYGNLPQQASLFTQQPLGLYDIQRKDHDDGQHDGQGQGSGQ